MKFLLLFLFCSQAFGFYLITNNGSHFKSKKVKVYITSNSTCTNTGRNADDILDLAVEGAKDTWNKVGKANIKVVKGGTYTTSDANFLTGELCVADSDTTCGAGTVPQVSNIVIACNNNTTNFPSAGTLAISAPINIEGNKIKGSVILLNDRAISVLNQFSKSEMKKILAHEIGHALGIGHSKDDDAMMYSTNIIDKNGLAEDDILAITHLYPYGVNEIDCTGFIGSTSTNDDTNPPNHAPFHLSLGFLSIFLVIKLFQYWFQPLSKA
jgi:hypothetical protein